MSVYIKLLLGCLIAVILSLTVKKNNAEMALLIMITCVFFCLSTSASIASSYKSDLLNLFERLNLPINTFLPMFKCLLISFITQISCNLCKDAGSSAVACSLELAGNIAILICMLPLLEKMFQIIGGLL